MMKNFGKGFVGPLLLVIIAILLVGGGAYVVYTPAEEPTQPADEILFSASPTSGPTPLSVAFTVTNSTGIDSLVVDFGDGKSSSDWILWTDGGGASFVSHTYPSPGTYTARLYTPIRDCEQVGTLCDEQTFGTAVVTITSTVE